MRSRFSRAARDAANAFFRRKGYALRWIPPRALAGRGGTIELTFPLLAAHLMLRIPRPYFLNIGANDGVTIDPLFPFVRDFGWRGAAVEPLPEAFAALKANYAAFPGMTFIQAAIGERDGTSTIYTVEANAADALAMSVHSSFSRDVLLRGKEFHSEIESHITTHEVPTMTVATLLRAIPAAIDVLKIDAEGYDLAILRGFDLAHTRPWLIMAEHANLTRQDVSTMADILLDHGYKIWMTSLDMLAAREND